jgi:hypothetical protein
VADQSDPNSGLIAVHRKISVESRRSVKILFDDLITDAGVQIYPEVEARGFFPFRSMENRCS